MRSPFVIYFAGVGTVVAALGIGFGGGIALTKTSVVKETAAMSALRREKLRTAGADIAKAANAKPENAKAENVADVANAADPRTPAAGESSAAVEPRSKSLLNITTATPVVAPAHAATQPAAVPDPAQAAAVRHTTAGDGTEAKEAAVRKTEKEKRRHVAEQRRRRDFAARQQSEDDLRADDAGTESRVVTRRVLDSDRGPDSDAELEAGPGVRSYENRSRGFAGLFGGDDED